MKYFQQKPLKSHDLVFRENDWQQIFDFNSPDPFGGNLSPIQSSQQEKRQQIQDEKILHKEDDKPQITIDEELGHNTQMDQEKEHHQQSQHHQSAIQIDSSNSQEEGEEGEEESSFQLSEFSYTQKPREPQQKVPQSPTRLQKDLKTSFSSNRHMREIAKQIQSIPLSQGCDIITQLSTHFMKVEKKFGIAPHPERRLRLREAGQDHQNPKIKFDEVDNFSPQGQEERDKIQIQIQNLARLDLVSKMTNRSVEEFKDLIRNLFLESNYLLFREMTAEFYEILRRVCNIVIEFLNRNFQKKRKRDTKY